MTSASYAVAQPTRLMNVANTRAGKAVLIVAATALMALAAHVSVPLPFSPVPLTLQTFAVILIGMVLGPAGGAASMLLYLAEGAAGLPVFSPHGPGGTAQLLGPTAGFLFSYPAAAALAGWIVRTPVVRWATGLRALVAGSLATTLFLASGAAWLAGLLHLSGSAVLHLAVAPFVPGELVKIVAAAMLFSSIQPSRRTQQGRPAR